MEEQEAEVGMAMFEVIIAEIAAMARLSEVNTVEKIGVVIDMAAAGTIVGTMAAAVTAIATIAAAIATIAAAIVIIKVVNMYSFKPSVRLARSHYHL